MIKNVFARLETLVRFLCWEDPLEKQQATPVFLSFPCGSAGKESACNVGDLGSIPGWERFPGEGNGYLLQYSGLENSMDYVVYGVATCVLSSVQFSHSVMSTSLRPCGLQHARPLSITNSWSLLKLLFIESVMPSNHLILCHLLLLLPSIWPRIRVFSNESALRIRRLNIEVSASA